MKVAERIARRHMRSQIADPELLEKVTPDYTIGCKRILPSNQLVPGALPAQRRAAHRRRRAGHGELDRDRRRRGARGRRDHLRHRLPGHRHAGRAAGARAAGQDARRALAGQPEGPPRRDHARLPEPVRAARPQHRARALLDGLHDRVAGGLRDGRAAPHGPPRRRHGGGPRGRRRALQRRPRRAHAGHGLEHRLRELVPRRDRPQRDAVAGLDLALPPAHRALRPRGLRAHAAHARHDRSR